MKEGAAEVIFATLHPPDDACWFKHPDTPSVAGFDQRSRTAANMFISIVLWHYLLQKPFHSSSDHVWWWNKSPPWSSASEQTAPPLPTKPSVWAACFSLTLPLLSSPSIDVGWARPLLSCREIQAMGAFILLHTRLKRSQDQRGCHNLTQATIAARCRGCFLCCDTGERGMQNSAVISRIWNW